jgi:hypothetical protein
MGPGRLGVEIAEVATAFKGLLVEELAAGAVSPTWNAADAKDKDSVTHVHPTT